MSALNSNPLSKKNCNLWSNIGGLHDGIPERSGHPNLNGPYQKINFITTNCCQYRVIWCKCSPVINKVFTIACYKCFTKFINNLLSLSWQEFACAHVRFITFMCRNRIYFCFAILRSLSRDWQSQILRLVFSPGASPLILPPALRRKLYLWHIFSLSDLFAKLVW